MVTSEKPAEINVADDLDNKIEDLEVEKDLTVIRFKNIKEEEKDLNVRTSKVIAGLLKTSSVLV